MPRTVFISVANQEHEALRVTLRDVLSRAGFNVVVQPDFPHTASDTVRKLDQLIAPCDLLLHIVGRNAGSPANSDAVADFFAHMDRAAFLSRLPKVRDRLGDFQSLTYFQWEPWLALQRKIPVLVYGIDGHAAANFPVRAHLDALREARCHADTLKDESARSGQIVADVCVHFGMSVTALQRLAPPRFLHHSAEIFLGREKELALLDGAWADGTNVLCLVAWGGVGKTALLTEWLQTRFIDKQWLDAGGKPALLAYFDWSFYDQGTRALGDKTAVRTGSVGDFFEQALTFFGDENPSRPGKGQRLAELVRHQRALLILDGLEPLQEPVGSAMAGRVLDPDLRDLVCALAQANPGLCIISSRQAVADLAGLHGCAARTEEIDDLPKSVAVRLLRRLQITGTDRELEEACEKFGCHALSLTLLGRFLFDAYQGDINRIDRVRDLRKADRLTREERHRTAWRVLAAYEEWLARAQADTNPTTLAVLRLTGLFDRVASADCLGVLRAEPIIPGLTEPLHGMEPDEWNILLHRLERAHLIKLRPSSNDAAQLDVDAHPLVREYFARQLKERHPRAFGAAHSRLFKHLCETTEYQPDTMAGMQPLYQAVVHGCLAGRQREARQEVYIDRILRGTGRDGFYSWKKLGAVGADLGAVAAFFDEPWSRLSANLSAPAQSWLLGDAALRLRALGRLAEAVEPMRVGLERHVERGDWLNAAIGAGNLSGLEVTLGWLREAVADGRRSIELADRSGDPFQKMSKRSATADALHQAGERAEADELFATAERMQAEMQPQFPLLYSLQGFLYADVLLAPAERAAWQAVLRGAGYRPEPRSAGEDDPAAGCAEAERRASQTLTWATTVVQNASLLDIALGHLTLTRARLYRALLFTAPATASTGLPAEISTALAKLREANSLHHLPQALLTATLHAGTLARQLEEARRLLDETQMIAERGPMPLYLADVHLHRARLFRDRAELAKARTLIDKHGYWRRREELEDAEAAAAHWSSPGRPE